MILPVLGFVGILLVLSQARNERQLTAFLFGSAKLEKQKAHITRAFCFLLECIFLLEGSEYVHKPAIAAVREVSQVI